MHSCPVLVARICFRLITSKKSIQLAWITDNLLLCPCLFLDFLQENYPSFDLKETGYDWKACVAAMNGTIRSLRHDHKKSTIGIRPKVLAVPPLSVKSPPQSPTSVKPFESDTINLTDWSSLTSVSNLNLAGFYKSHGEACYIELSWYTELLTALNSIISWDQS